MAILDTAIGQTTSTIWPTSAVPAVVDGGAGAAVELGVKFRSDVSGFITGIRFYKASTNTGAHIGNLWTSTGTRLATATFANETAIGWQQVNFTSPVAITANTVYVASYHTNVSHYSIDENYFTGKGMDSPPLHALASGVSGSNGVYRYSANSVFPNQSWRTSNYWVDVVFSTSGASDSTPPTITTFTIPQSSATLAIPINSLTATDNVGVTGYRVTESATAPSATGAGWTAVAPTSYTFATAGTKTLYAWAKDGANNVSSGASAVVTVTLADTTAPIVTAFAVPATSNGLAVPITSFGASDNIGVIGYVVTESPTTPSPASGGWSAAPPTSYTFATAGTKTLYAWAKDAANNVSASRSATVVVSEQTTFSIWPASTVPGVVDGGPDSAVEIGVKFRADVNGFITGIRFYKATTNTGTHVGNLWTTTGTRLATANFSSETASGWQQVMFSAPVAITANTVYVASYHTNGGHYSADENYFATTGTDRPPLHALADGVSGVNGVYAYGSSSSFPNEGWRSTNYWVDVVFSATAASDTIQPTVTAFTIPASFTSLTVPITSFLASDNIGVSGYLVTESSTVPAAGASGWSVTAPNSYTFSTTGTKTLYAWAKDAAGNVSASVSASITITLGDTTPPVVTAFAIPATSSSLTVPITSLTATDNVGVTGYLVTESASTPSAGAAGWSAAAPSSYTFSAAGAKTLYAWAKDGAGNISASRSTSVTVTLPVDTTPPTVTGFVIPSTSSTLTVPVSSLTAIDNVGVAGYLVTETSATPSAVASGWSVTPPASYVFATAGAKTLYAWAKDAANNVSASRSASVVITISASGPEPAGWFAGDIHAHRSCGGSPESLSSIKTKMDPNNLAVISLLADMGNAEVQNATTDLPLVNGQNASISSPGRIIRWDTEWHWDAIYSQYPHQALGGHLVALGLSEAHQIWEEYTYPILNWARQQGAIAGFAHMQYLDGGIPQSLTCCTPIEYPVEVALGAADFISEDVDDNNSGINMYPDNFLQAYYKLLNTGFRPGFAAGTDYPCNSNRPLGALLTYSQIPSGPVTYENWIQGIKNGRTVVSRNGHKEFLGLTVNGTATPGDEINLTAAAAVPVTVQWTATQNISATMELVSNGVVVATRTATVTAGTPVIWNTTIDFPKSGWVVARTMGNDGHLSHTAAVFVIIANAPIRASAADAQYFVQWIDNLLAKIAPGGPWNWYFPTKLAQVQARYQAARAIFQQRATEAGGVTPLPSGPSIFTTQTPTLFENEAAYELGTRFWSDVNGQITQVRLYTSALEGGSHTVRVWQVNGPTMVAGPYTWNITAGSEGWKTFTLPTPVPITANSDYIVAVSNSSDRWYASSPQGFASPIVNGYLHTYTGSGVYSTTLGTIPTSTWSNSITFAISCSLRSDSFSTSSLVTVSPAMSQFRSLAESWRRASNPSRSVLPGNDIVFLAPYA